MGNVQVAMLAGALYTLLRDAVFTHPTMSKTLGMLFARVAQTTRRGCGGRTVTTDFLFVRRIDPTHPTRPMGICGRRRQVRVFVGAASRCRKLVKRMRTSRHGKKRRILRAKILKRSGFYFWSGTVRRLSLESTTKTANRLAGSLSLAFSLIL